MAGKQPNKYQRANRRAKRGLKPENIFIPHIRSVSISHKLIKKLLPK